MRETTPTTTRTIELTLKEAAEIRRYLFCARAATYFGIPRPTPEENKAADALETLLG